ncbi:MAG TPA: ABC transporter ATP-binding protein [Acidimicrobiales bacterium]|nr:ABC transporter ATP-binding protein [Acidimicrobiales bacterium]
MLIRLLRIRLRPYRGMLAVVFGLQAVQALASLYLPNLNAKIIDNGVMRGNTHYIWHLGMIMVVVTAVQLAFAVAAVYYGARTGMGFGRDLRGAIFHRVTSFSAQEVNTFGAPSLITRITNDVQQVQLLVVMSATMVLAAPVTVVGGVIMAVNQTPGLSWLLAVSVSVLMCGLGLIISRMVPTFRLMQERIDRINQVLREQISGMRVVRAFTREPQEAVRFDQGNTLLTASGLRAGRLMALMFPMVLLVINGSSVGVVWFGGDRIAQNSMTVGSLVAFLTYFTLILTAVMQATFVAFMAPRAAVSAERIQEVLSTEPSVVPPGRPVRSMVSPGTLEIRDVSFGYPGADQPVLSGISLRSLPGETTAIIGSTGSGKTSLINLVARLFDVTTGEVLVGGVDVRQLDPLVLWSRVGLVPQKPYLFSGTVASNLRYGAPAATEEEMWEALRVAQAADFVAAMPGGLEASITQGGSNVSGGQRQRLSIARALVRRPDVYLFDDSFSALDLSTDARLRAALEPWTRQSTVVVVAQRVASIRRADRILVLEDGLPVGLGTHDELTRTCPTYQEIVESQFRGEEVA